jgi:hypothetical protein
VPLVIILVDGFLEETNGMVHQTTALGYCYQRIETCQSKSENLKTGFMLLALI